MFGRGGGNVGGAVEHLAVTTHRNDLAGTVLDAIDAYAAGAAGRGDTDDDSYSTRATGQAIVFVETKTFAEQLSGTLAIAYEVSDSASLSLFCFFFPEPPPLSPGRRSGRARRRSMITSRSS